MKYRVGLLGLSLIGLGCGEDPQPAGVEIELESIEPAFAPLEYDSGWVEVAEGVSVQLVSSLETELEQTAVVLARGDELDPQPGSGSFLVRATLTVELFATLGSAEVLALDAEFTPPRQFDLGSYALEDGSPVEGTGPCGEVVDGELVE